MHPPKQCNISYGNVKLWLGRFNSCAILLKLEKKLGSQKLWLEETLAQKPVGELIGDGVDAGDLLSDGGDLLSNGGDLLGDCGHLAYLHVATMSTSMSATLSVTTMSSRRFVRAQRR